MIEFGLLRRTQHEPNTVAIKEGEVSGSEQQLEAEDVAIESNRPVGVVNVDCNLANLLNGEATRRDDIASGCHLSPHGKKVTLLRGDRVPHYNNDDLLTSANECF